MHKNSRSSDHNTETLNDLTKELYYEMDYIYSLSFI